MSEIRVDTIKAEDGISSPTFPSEIQVLLQQQEQI